MMLWDIYDFTQFQNQHAWKVTTHIKAEHVHSSHKAFDSDGNSFHILLHLLNIFFSVNGVVLYLLFALLNKTSFHADMCMHT